MKPTWVCDAPARCRVPLELAESEALRDYLTYEDKKVTFEWLRWRKVLRAAERGHRHWFVEQQGLQALVDKVAALEASRQVTLLGRDEGGLWTHAGLAPGLARRFGGEVSPFPRPEPLGARWASEPPPMRPYQAEAFRALVERGHAAVELPTGSGKSRLIAEVVRHVGRPTLVLAPTLSIAQQLALSLEKAFGAKRVGRMFGGARQAKGSWKKFVTVAANKSATNAAADPDCEAFKCLAAKEVMIVDESHMFGSESLSHLALGMLAWVPWRFSFSGTQLRGDGTDMVLEGVIGDIVYRKDILELTPEYLTPLRFTQMRVRSTREPLEVGDPLRANRLHLQTNPSVLDLAADVAVKAASRGRRVLVMTQEVEQGVALIPRLAGQRVGFAYGGITPKQRENLPEKYWKSDPQQLVGMLDNNNLDILIGTQCVGTGTDFQSVDFIIDLVGLTSSVRVPQNAGRGTRRYPGKKVTDYVDFDVTNVPDLTKHAATRLKMFEQMGEVRVR